MQQRRRNGLLTSSSVNTSDAQSSSQMLSSASAMSAHFASISSSAIRRASSASPSGSRLLPVASRKGRGPVGTRAPIDIASAPRFAQPHTSTPPVPASCRTEPLRASKPTEGWSGAAVCSSPHGAQGRQGAVAGSPPIMGSSSAATTQICTATAMASTTRVVPRTIASHRVEKMISSARLNFRERKKRLQTELPAKTSAMVRETAPLVPLGLLTLQANTAVYILLIASRICVRERFNPPASWIATAPLKHSTVCDLCCHIEIRFVSSL
jgi:hypothetical protein